MSNKIYNTNHQRSEDYWLNELKSNLQKSAVQSKEKDDYLFNQINSIINGTKSKYSSVADAVEEMKERSGLTAYLTKVKLSETNETKKIASDSSSEPVVFKNNSSIQKTLENYISSTKGNMPIPAILNKIMSIHKLDVPNPSEWEDPNLIKLISQLNLKEKAGNPHTYEVHSNLGLNESPDVVSPENTDAWHHLLPATY